MRHAAFLLLMACGGSNKALIPVDSPLRPWQPQEEPALAPDEAPPEPPLNEGEGTP